MVCIPLVSCLGKDDGNDKAVETKGFSEDQDKDHTNEDVFLGVGTHTSITDDTDGETGSQGGQTDTEAGSQELVALVGSEAVAGAIAGSGDGTVEDDTDDQTVDTEDTSHNNGDK